MQFIRRDLRIMLVYSPEPVGDPSHVNRRCSNQYLQVGPLQEDP
jgi:hypothetical protein